MFSRKIQSLCIALFWLCAAVPQMAFAEYPEHPVTVYHPFEPTPYDALSKVYNAEMSKILGVPFVFAVFAQTQIRVVLTEQQTVFRAARHHTVRLDFGCALCL